MGGVAIFKKRINFTAEGSCRGAPLCSRIVTFLTSCLPPVDLIHFMVPLPPPTTSYHLLPHPTTSLIPPPSTCTISSPHMYAPSASSSHLPHLLSSSTSPIYAHIHFQHPPPSTCPIYLPQLLTPSSATSPLYLLHPPSPSSSTSCLPHPPPLNLFV